MNQTKARIQELLETMDVPKERKTDYCWLLGNVGIRNSDHPNFSEIRILLVGVIRSGIK
jgi:hypothetical protein